MYVLYAEESERWEKAVFIILLDAYKIMWYLMILVRYYY